MASTAHTSLQLWAAAKIVGRECATVSKEYFLCKKEKGENPAECLKEAQAAMKCTSNVITEVSTKFPAEFISFQNCLDDNDYRYADCRVQERYLLDCWNKKN